MDLERVPANVYTAAFAPHSRLLPLADVVVTHAGLGTVHAALAHGKPLVCLPIGRDQPDNAARLIERGAAIRLAPKTSSATIAESISTVLGDTRYAEAARRLSAAMGYEAARSLGWNELIRLTTSPESSVRERAA
jgi:UDP:flavonoid glycosyltransferase YjiC (YdhE family)